MNPTGILEQAQRDRMHRRIPPPLIKEPARPIQMLEIILIRPAAPKLHIRDLKVAPKMAGRVPIGLLMMLRPLLSIPQPAQGAIVAHILRVLGHKLQRLGPQGRDGFRRVVQVDGEAVRLVVVGHVAEDVVVDVAEEVHFGLHAPVVAGVRQGRVFVEEAAVPAAHLVVGGEVGVLHLLLFEDVGGFFEEVGVDPGGDGPVVWGDEFWSGRLEG